MEIRSDTFVFFCEIVGMGRRRCGLEGNEKVRQSRRRERGTDSVFREKKKRHQMKVGEPEA